MEKHKIFMNSLNLAPFHLVNPSVWPFVVSLSLYNCLLLFVGYFYNFKLAYFELNLIVFSLKIYSPLLYISIFMYFLYQWFSDIISEATYEGHHTMTVQKSMYMGGMFFMLSEIMFFFSFFWAFFHVSLSPSIYLNLNWPPLNFSLLDSYSLPLLNTVMLLSSGLTVTYAHKSCLMGERLHTMDGLLWTALYGLLFTCIQGYEYCFCNYSINDGMFGSMFFLLTGFHGAHVLMGSTFLSMCLYRQMEYHFTKQHHMGLEFSMLYWHMVDGIWLFLYILIYLN